MKKILIFVSLLLITTVAFSQRTIANKPIYILNDLALDTIDGGFLFSDTSFIFEFPTSARAFNIQGVGDSLEDTVQIILSHTNDADSVNSYMPFDTLIFDSDNPLGQEYDFITYPYLIIDIESISADTNSGYFDLMFKMVRQYKD